MGHWDHQAIELQQQETPEQIIEALPRSHGFHANGVIRFQQTHWLHLGWDDANALAYRALVQFCQDTGRQWITSYATDPRALLDAHFFGRESLSRKERLSAVFGPPREGV